MRQLHAHLGVGLAYGRFQLVNVRRRVIEQRRENLMHEFLVVHGDIAQLFAVQYA